MAPKSRTLECKNQKEGVKNDPKKSDIIYGRSLKQTRKTDREISNHLCFKVTEEHSMVMGNLNKSKETKPTTTTALNLAP